MTVNLPGHLSWSQVSAYSQCGERYRIEKLYRLPRPNYYTTLAGSAVHTLTESIDRALLAGLDFDVARRMADGFEEEFYGEVDRWLEQNPDGELLASQKKGMKSITEHGGPNGKDYHWWLHWGPIYVRRYVNWRERNPQLEIATLPDGSPGIELEFVISIDDIRVVGYIDRLLLDTDSGELVMLDIKNGKMPDSHLQLVTYAMGMWVTHGVRASRAAYWLPRSPAGYDGSEVDNVGQVSDMVSLSDWDHDKMAAMFTGVMRGISNGVFMPNVTSMCKGCSVRQFCWAVGGLKAGKLPVYDEIVDTADGQVVFDGPLVRSV